MERVSSFGDELRGAVTFSPSHNSDASDSRVGASDGSFESGVNSAHINNGKEELSAQIGSPASCSGSLADWVLPGSCHGSLSAGSNGIFQTVSSYGRDHREETQYEMSNCSATFNFAAGDTSNASDFRGALDSNQLKSETEFFQLGHLEGDGYSQCM